MNLKSILYYTVAIDLALSNSFTVVQGQEVGSGVRRTPDQRFAAIDDYPVNLIT